MAVVTLHGAPAPRSPSALPSMGQGRGLRSCSENTSWVRELATKPPTAGRLLGPTSGVVLSFMAPSAPPLAGSSRGQEEGTGLWLAPQDRAWHAVGTSETTWEGLGQRRGYTGNRRHLPRETGPRSAGEKQVLKELLLRARAAKAPDRWTTQRGHLTSRRPRAGLHLEATHSPDPHPARRAEPLAPPSPTPVPFIFPPLCFPPQNPSKTPGKAFPCGLEHAGN